MTFALFVLLLSAAGDPVADQARYDTTMKCAVSLFTMDQLLTAGGRGPSQMGRMAETYATRLSTDGVSLGKSVDSIRSEFVSNITTSETELNQMSPDRKRERHRELLDQAKLCATRLIGDGDKK